jgi:hypothetical protein
MTARPIDLIPFLLVDLPRTVPALMYGSGPDSTTEGHQ